MTDYHINYAIEALSQSIQGEVHTDPMTRGIYATDASNYQITPLAVVLPKSEDDILKVLACADEYNIPITPRAGGTSLGGQVVGKSIIIDCSKYMDQILEINAEEKWVRVQPGVVRDQLNKVLVQHDLFFAPDPATTSRANIGGMIGNNSSGARSIIYGKTVDHLLECKVALLDGTILDIKNNSIGIDSNHLDEFKDIIHINYDEIKKRYPKTMRRVGGYNLDEFVQADHWNLSKLFCGSEGTLGFLLEAKIHLESLPKQVGLCVVHYDTLMSAINSVTDIVKHQPSAVEIFDNVIIDLARSNPESAKLCDFLEKDPQAVLIVEFYSDTPEELNQKLNNFVSDMQSKQIGYAWPIRTDKQLMANIWTVRKNGLGLLLGMKGEKKPMAFIEDAAIPLEHLADYIDQLLAFCKSIQCEVAMYAHASVGVLHVRPILDLKQSDDIEKMKQIADTSFNLVKHYNGSWSSEHGDGLVRSSYMEDFYGPQIYNTFKQIKQLFDPKGLMNPGKIVDGPAMDQNLRFGPEYQVQPINSVYHYLDDGSFSAAVEMCSGVGACRQTLAGTMCPSYRVTRDEAHSTRGRANALRLAMSGQLDQEGLASNQVHEVLDLCLSCKACKSECPSTVDMAKLKSEFLQHYYDTHGTKLRDKLICNSRKMAELFSGFFAPFINFIQNLSITKSLQEKYIGIDQRRRLPDYTSQTFPSWFKNQKRKASPKKVVLFNDTYINFHEPHVGIAAVELLESCGYEVILANAGCCQRPRISNGFLRQAKQDGRQTLAKLDRFIRDGLQIVCCEPSCASALTDDLPDLIGNKALRERIKDNVKMIDLFLQEELEAGNIKGQFKSLVDDITLHGHCHQKALYGTKAIKEIYSQIENCQFKELDSGCCGMAGSFGYEKEHYDLSVKVAEDKLLPKLNDLKDQTTIVTCGFSCRHQIKDLTNHQPLHWVETIRGIE